MRPGQAHRISNWAVGAAVLAAVLTGFLIAFFKQDLPWKGGYEVSAVFSTSQGIREHSPVRIAGIDVGEVTSTRLLSADQQAAYRVATGSEGGGTGGLQPLTEVTMSLGDDALPLKEDATFKLRPRLFLEGNLFVDLDPGSPQAPEVSEGESFSLAHTAVSVQLDEVLTTLQGDVRANLQTLLAEFGDALIEERGAEGLRELYRTSPGAFRWTAVVNDAFLGTSDHDLSGLITNLDRVVASFGRDERALQGVVTNLNTVSAALAANPEALRASIAELPRALRAAGPALASLNAAFPPARALAREALPGVRGAPAALAAGTPLIHQLRELAAAGEARGLVADLRPAVPHLARFSGRVAVFMEQARALSSCFNEVVIPWSNDSVSAPAPYPFNPLAPVYQETGVSLVGAGGESRSADANGGYVRAFSGSGSNIVVIPPNGLDRTEDSFGITPEPILGAVPAKDSSAKTPFRPDVACETQEPPDLEAGAIGSPPTQMSARSAGSAPAPSAATAYTAKMIDLLAPLERAAELAGAGDTDAAAALRDRVLRRYRRYALRERAPQLRAIRRWARTREGSR